MTVSLAFFVSFLGNAKKKEKLFKTIHKNVIGRNPTVGGMTKQSACLYTAPKILNIHNYIW